MNHLKLSVLFIGAASILPSQAAVTFAWGAQTVGAEIQSSDGSVKDVSSTIFELGIFADDFVPTLSNAADWRENFTVVGSDPGEAGEGVLQQLGVTTTPFPPPNGAPVNTAGQSVSFGSNFGEVSSGAGTNLPEGAKLYIWAYDAGEEDFDPTSSVIPEWLLLSNDEMATHDGLAGWSENTNEVDSDNWVVPSDGIQSHNPTNLNLLTATANEEVVGQNSLGTNPGDILRFQAVPEPSSSISLMLGLGLMAMRRKRVQ